MVTTTGYLYLITGTVLFFFWVYGIVSFVVDVKRQVIPWIREYRKRRAEEQSGSGDHEQLSKRYEIVEDEYEARE